MRQCLALLAAALLALPACSSETSASSAGTSAGDTSGSGGGSTSGPGLGQPSALELYGPDIKTIAFEIDYAKGAEPYTGALLGNGDGWNLFADNAARLFEGTDKTLKIPRALDQMEELADVTGEDFTADTILSIAKQHRDLPNTADTATFYFIWLPGYYADESGRREEVLGVSLWDTGVLAMFKPVIASTGSGGPGPGVERFVEQATLVHEFGHAAGLVNNGISMATPHQDEEHGAHCDNQDCVMYYAIEGASDLVSYVQKVILAGDTDLFGDECLADTKKALAQ